MEKVENRGRKKFDVDKKKLVKVLMDIRDGNAVLTHYMKHRMENEDYLKLEKVETGKRGRPKFNLVLTGKANRLIALSKAWK